MQLAWILLFYDKEWVRTQFSTVYETANGVQLKYFCKVRILCSKCSPPAETLAFRCLGNFVVNRCLPQVIPDLLQCTFSSGMVLSFQWSLWNASTLHSAHDSQVGWGLVILVVVHPSRWSRYWWHSTSPASDRLRELERCLARIWIPMETIVCSRRFSKQFWKPIDMSAMAITS